MTKGFRLRPVEAGTGPVAMEFDNGITWLPGEGKGGSRRADDLEGVGKEGGKKTDGERRNMQMKPL